MPPNSDKQAEVISIATHLFWRDGYEGVSIDDVVKASGLNRYALYQSFGGKKGLFLASLETYCGMGKTMVLEFLADPKLSAFESIRLSLNAKINNSEMFEAGCLMTTTAVELASKDPEVADRMQVYMGELKGLLTAAISRAQAEGDIDPNADTTACAELVHNLFIGAGVQARMGVPKDQLQKNLDAALCALKQK